MIKRLAEDLLFDYSSAPWPLCCCDNDDDEDDSDDNDDDVDDNNNDDGDYDDYDKFFLDRKISFFWFPELAIHPHVSRNLSDLGYQIGSAETGIPCRLSNCWAVCLPGEGYLQWYYFKCQTLSHVCQKLNKTSLIFFKFRY